MKYGVAVALTALVVAAGCSASDLYQPLSPDPNSSAKNESSARSGSLHIEKDCTNYFGRAGDTCTITKSNFKGFEVGSVIHYLQAANPDFTISTDVILDPPGSGGSNTAFGHCTVDLRTGTGVCGFSGGYGEFRSFRAIVAVSPVGGPIYAWDGTYSYGR